MTGSIGSKTLELLVYIIVVSLSDEIDSQSAFLDKVNHAVLSHVSSTIGRIPALDKFPVEKVI